MATRSRQDEGQLGLFLKRLTRVVSDAVTLDMSTRLVISGVPFIQQRYRVQPLNLLLYKWGIFMSDLQPHQTRCRADNNAS